MTQEKRNPTNRDIMEKLNSLAIVQESMNSRLVVLENWKIAVEAAKEALKEFRASKGEEEVKNEPLSNKAMAALITTILTLGGVITVIIAKLL